MSVSEVNRNSSSDLPLKCPRRCDTSTTPSTGVPLGRITRPFASVQPSSTSPSKRVPGSVCFTLMFWLMRMASSDPAGIFTSAGCTTGGPPGTGCPAPCAVPDG